MRKTRFMGVRLTPEQWKKLEDLADRRGVSVSAALRDLVDRSNEDANSHSAQILADAGAMAAHA